MDYARLILRRVLEPITEPVTKFGGLPVWVGEPAWPCSAATGEQMLFIGQIVIERPLFDVESPRVAYVFITETDDATTGELATWDPDSGENAVIIQSTSAEREPTIIDGPCLNESYWQEGVHQTRPVELAATVSIETKPAEVPYEEVKTWDPARQNEHDSALGQRIGGLPDWIQQDETPEDWSLLLQMGEYPWVGSESIQTNWNFGTGSCYVLISPDCSQGILFWQC